MKTVYASEISPVKGSGVKPLGVNPTEVLILFCSLWFIGDFLFSKTYPSRSQIFHKHPFKAINKPKEPTIFPIFMNLWSNIPKPKILFHWMPNPPNPIQLISTWRHLSCLVMGLDGLEGQQLGLVTCYSADGFRAILCSAGGTMSIWCSTVGFMVDWGSTIL